MDPQSPLKQGMQQSAGSTGSPQPAPEPQDSKVKGQGSKVKGILVLLLILFVLLLLGAVGYFAFWYGKKVGGGTSTTTTTTETTTTTSTTTSETTDPYEGWKTYENDLLGYKVRYPTTYTLAIRYETDERCVYFSKGEVSINIGRTSTADEDLLDSCFRTGMGATVEEYKTVSYTVNGNTYTSDEIYEDFDEDGSNGKIYGALNFGNVEGMDDVIWGLEYHGQSKAGFEAERDTVEKIIESITW